MDVVNVNGSEALTPKAESAAMWLVGCGNMAGAMVEGWRLAGADLSKATAIRPSGTPVEGVRTVRSIGEAGMAPGVAILGFKPQMLDEVAPVLASAIGAETIILSLLAGTEVAALRKRFPRASAIVRVMPNIAVAVRRGVTAVHGEELDAAQRRRVAELLMPLGFVAWCNSEEELVAIGGTAGSGPAYVARFIAAMAKAAEGKGIDPALALTIARETVFGTGWLAASEELPMDEIVRRVKSPKGTTEAGLEVLDAELPGLFERTVEAAGRRSAELAEAAREA